MFPLGLIQHYWFHHSVSIKHSLYDLVAFYTEPASYEREPASMRHRITKKLVQTKATTFSFFAGSSCRKAHVCAGACFCLASDWACTGTPCCDSPASASARTWVSTTCLCWARLVPEATEHPGYELAPWSACICIWVILILTDISGLDFRGADVKVWIAKSHGILF